MQCQICKADTITSNYMTLEMCQTCKEIEQELQRTSAANAELRVRLITEFHEYRMTPNEELFAKYYNRGKILVSEMDDTALREHRESLQQIATEAKAQLMAADDEVRERKAKNGKSKDWLVSIEGDSRATDAINAVKTRTARMSKMDKSRKQLLDIGIDEKTVDEMIKNMERKATEKNLKTITFNKPSTEKAVVVVRRAAEPSGEAFDPTKLFGK